MNWNKNGTILQLTILELGQKKFAQPKFYAPVGGWSDDV